MKLPDANIGVLTHLKKKLRTFFCRHNHVVFYEAEPVYVVLAEIILRYVFGYLQSVGLKPPEVVASVQPDMVFLPVFSQPALWIRYGRILVGFRNVRAYREGEDPLPLIFQHTLYFGDSLRLVRYVLHHVVTYHEVEGPVAELLEVRNVGDVHGPAGDYVAGVVVDIWIGPDQFPYVLLRGKVENSAGCPADMKYFTHDMVLPPFPVNRPAAGADAVVPVPPSYDMMLREHLFLYSARLEILEPVAADVALPRAVF